MNKGKGEDGEVLDFINATEFATLIGCSAVTILRWSKTKQPFPRQYRFGSKTKFLRAEVMQWISEPARASSHQPHASENSSAQRGSQGVGSSPETLQPDQPTHADDD